MVGVITVFAFHASLHVVIPMCGGVGWHVLSLCKGTYSACGPGVFTQGGSYVYRGQIAEVNQSKVIIPTSRTCTISQRMYHGVVIIMLHHVLNFLAKIWN